jgi:hypothetical protein
MSAISSVLKFEASLDQSEKMMAKIQIKKIDYFSHLPSVIYQNVFNYLHHQDFVELTNVSKLFLQETVFAKWNIEKKQIHKFIKNLINRLDQEPQHVNMQKLSNVQQEMDFDDFKSFREIQKYTGQIKDRLIEVLKSFKTQTLYDLKNTVNKNTSLIANVVFEDIFTWSLFEKRIDSANSLENFFDKSHELKAAIHCCYINLQPINCLTNFSRLIEVGHSITHFESKDMCFHDLTCLLIREEQMEMAQKVACLIQNHGMRTKSLMKIFSVFMKYHQINCALNVIAKISQEHTKSYCLAEIIKLLQSKGQLDNAFNLTLRMKDSQMKNQILFNIAQAFFKKNNSEKAQEVISFIKDEQMQVNLLEKKS